MKRIITLLACALLVCAMAVPAFASKGEVKIAYVEWDCATASTTVAQAALESRGYDVEIIPVAAAAMWQAISTGDVDGMVTAWLPVTHADYLKRVEGDVENVGTLVGGAKLGWVVPSYVTIDSIDQLNANAEKFDGKVIGIDPGAGLMRLSEEAMEKYNLSNFELMEGSGATMTAALSNAIKEKRWVVATGWSPHWMFGRWDLKYLEDPKGVLGAEEHIDKIVRTDLKEDMPEVYTFFKNFTWKDPNQMQMVMAWNQEDGTTPEENAVKFVKENKEQVDSWFK